MTRAPSPFARREAMMRTLAACSALVTARRAPAAPRSRGTGWPDRAQGPPRSARGSRSLAWGRDARRGAARPFAARPSSGPRGDRPPESGPRRRSARRPFFSSQPEEIDGLGAARVGPRIDLRRHDVDRPRHQRAADVREEPRAVFGQRWQAMAPPPGSRRHISACAGAPSRRAAIPACSSAVWPRKSWR